MRESVLELAAHIGGATQCVPDLVQQRPEERLRGVQLVALDDDELPCLVVEAVEVV